MFAFPKLPTPLDLSSEYDYAGNGILIPNRLDLEKVLPLNLSSGIPHPDAIRLNNSFGIGYYKRVLVNSGVEDIIYDILVLSMPISKQAHAAITALKEGQLVGFRDFSVKYGEYITSTGNGNILSHLTPLKADENARRLLYPDMRDPEISLVDLTPIDSLMLQEDLSHSFVILPDFRGNDYGKHLFFTGLELASLLGSQEHYLTEDGTLNRKAAGKSYYDKYAKSGKFFKLRDY